MACTEKSSMMNIEINEINNEIETIRNKAQRMK